MGSHGFRTRSEAHRWAQAHRMGKGKLHRAPDFFLPPLTHSFSLEILTEHRLCDRCCGKLKNVTT